MSLSSEEEIYNELRTAEAEIERLRAALGGACDYLEAIAREFPDLIMPDHIQIPEAVARYRGALVNQQDSSLREEK